MFGIARKNLPHYICHQNFKLEAELKQENAYYGHWYSVHHYTNKGKVHKERYNQKSWYSKLVVHQKEVGKGARKRQKALKNPMWDE